MPGENDLITVFRSADADAEEQANAARDMLSSAGIPAAVFDDSAPGVPEGAFEVRVAAAEREEAEDLIEAQKDFSAEDIDPSGDLDMVAVFVSESNDAEMMALQIRSILDAQNIPSVLVSGAMMPNLPFEVRVAKVHLEAAREAIAAAEAAGPSGAEEAERESEASGAGAEDAV
ncbi:MAG: hypothetical protein ABSG25_08585 [Bryobacteraceae bacterium]